MRTLLVLMIALATTSSARATYSIVARDPETGELGVAVQSHWFSVGAIVTWAEPGVGAVATQANVEPGYGPRVLALLAAGKSAEAALAALVGKDDEREFRQVAVVDAHGRVAAHTGKQTIPFAGHKLGSGYSVQANIMASPAVWPAMARAYETHRGPLAERLLAALDAAQAAGGDVRGKQSAALLVVGPERCAKEQSDCEPWKQVRVNLRVDDSRDPLGELNRLYRVARAYERANAGDSFTARKDYNRAAAAYVEASRLAPNNEELLFWAALSQAAAADADRTRCAASDAACTRAAAKQMERAAAEVKRLMAKNRGWRALLPYLRPADSPGVPLIQKQLGIQPHQ